MPNVWYIGSFDERRITPAEWGVKGIITGATHVWNAKNAWSLDQSLFTINQLEILDRDPGFKLNQTGPRTMPALPDTHNDPEPSAFAYYKATKELYDLASLIKNNMELVLQTMPQMASDAIDADVASRDMLEADDPRIASFQIIDLPGDRVIIIKDPDGNIVAWCNTEGKWFFKFAPETQIPGTFETVQAYGTVLVIKDSSGNVLLRLDDAGRLHVSNLVAPNLTDDIFNALTSGPDIVSIGDSMSAGAGGGGTSYPSVLATLTGRTVHNRGVGGETSCTIAARMGASPILAKPVGGSIPSSGTVDLTFVAINGMTPAPLLQGGNDQYADVTFAGVRGAMTLVSGTYKFTRAATGSAVSINEPRAIIPADALARRGDIHIIWIGQNNSNDAVGIARAQADTAAIIQEMSGGQKRFLVMNRPMSNDAEDASWYALYGRRFLSPRKQLNMYGLAEMGITPTSTDLSDIAGGAIPESLRSDGIHLNADGYTALARLVHRRLNEFGWV